MPNAESPPQAGSSRARLPLPRFQYSLAQLMILVTLVAIALALAVTIGGFIGAIFSALVWCVLPTPLVICAIFGRDDVQAFAIGSLVPWFTMIMVHLPPPAAFIPSPIWLLILSGICGTVAAATQRWLVKSAG